MATPFCALVLSFVSQGFTKPIATAQAFNSGCLE
jgi:hypothetical protein